MPSKDIKSGLDLHNKFLEDGSLIFRLSEFFYSAWLIARGSRGEQANGPIQTMGSRLNYIIIHIFFHPPAEVAHRCSNTVTHASGGDDLLLRVSTWVPATPPSGQSTYGIYMWYRRRAFIKFVFIYSLFARPGKVESSFAKISWFNRCIRWVWSEWLFYSFALIWQWDICLRIICTSIKY
jgi:hypothetical protein